MGKKNKKKSTAEKKIIAFITLIFSVPCGIGGTMNYGIIEGLAAFLFFSLFFGWIISDWRNFGDYDP
jgi:hypothetical protein